ncbi:hypothetical protein GALL_316950 [mine drainage metagenome]|uniref:Uncharacterized protein n=1 Tax=mine drainage metagenome TaxID=410659 RepID=A0A1J5RE81_9ZZZZ
MEKLTVQTFVDGDWQDAAVVTFEVPERGIHGATKTVYDSDYFFTHAVEDAIDADVIDRRALSVGLPVTLESTYLKTWPAWLLDLLPQGVARQRLAQDIGVRADDPSVELRLLRLAGGAPIGNVRIREAWEDEQRRLAGVDCPPLTDDDIATRSDRFSDVVTRFALLASGSKGVQGEWPKALLTRSAVDGFWYPDPFVRTQDAIEHVIVKVLQSNNHEDGLIIASEAPYLEVARQFGLDVAAPLEFANGVLKIPRFDRSVMDGMVSLHGQESLVSALGMAEFGHIGFHEDYLSVVRAVSDDPADDVVEYVLRDVLNAAMGNPDNHGRNTALTKHADGGVRLAPLFDFAPMRLSKAMVGRSTRWRCLQGRDIEGHWDTVCDAAAFDGLPAKDIKAALLERAAFLRNLSSVAVEAGVPQEVVERACGDSTRVADAVERLEATCQRNEP